ncbi:MAG: SUMF1/EgtB/PvdO family nonheme iron enzyme [Chitinophagales bacterium]
MRNFLHLAVIAGVLAVSCSGSKSGSSSTTGWNYNDKKWGGFERSNNTNQITGPNLVLVEGGTFAMGATEEDLLYENHNVQRRTTVSSFYMDETEVTNLDYREYVYWLDRVFGTDPILNSLRMQNRIPCAGEEILLITSYMLNIIWHTLHTILTLS